MSDAWEEAARQYPPDSVKVEDYRERVLSTARNAFCEGAQWRANQPVEVTDEMVKRAGRAAKVAWQMTACTGDDCVVWPSVARAAIEAALGGTHEVS